MPASAGRVKMPGNNRVHSSRALQTHAIWSNTIGHDPYASADKPQNNAGQGAFAFEANKELLELASKSATNSHIGKRGACKKCNEDGHLTFQCRNSLLPVAKNNGLELPLSSDESSDSSEERRRKRKRKKEKRKEKKRNDRRHRTNGDNDRQDSKREINEMSETRDRISERRTRSREDIHFADYEANRRSVSIERRNPERGHRSVDEYHSKRRRGASVEREKSGGKNQDSGNHKTENETRAFSGYGSKGNRTKRLKSNRN